MSTTGAIASSGGQGGAGAAALVVPPDLFSMRDLFGHVLLMGFIVFAGTGAILFYRMRIAALLHGRTIRLFAELLLPMALAGVVALLVAFVDWRALLSGVPASGDLRRLWVLAVCAGLYADLQVLTAVHADASERSRESLVSSHKKEKLMLERQLEDAREQRDFASIVSEAFLRVVSRKRERLSKAADRLQALQPVLQSQLLIAACWEIVDKMINDTRTQEAPHRVRVAYFRVEGRKLVPVHCWDGTRGDCITPRIQNDPEISQRFDLDSGSTCLALAACTQGVSFWVENAAASAKKRSHPFEYFDESAERDLKSIVALPIKAGAESSPYDVITIDTDREGFFHGDQDQEIRLMVVVKNLAHRLQLEKSLEPTLPEGR